MTPDSFLFILWYEVNPVPLDLFSFWWYIDNIDNYDPDVIRTDCLKRFEGRIVVEQLMEIYKKVICKK